MSDIPIGSASVALVLRAGKLVLDIKEQIGPIAGPPLEIDLTPADALALISKGFGSLFGKK